MAVYLGVAMLIAAAIIIVGMVIYSVGFPASLAVFALSAALLGLIVGGLHLTRA